MPIEIDERFIFFDSRDGKVHVDCLFRTVKPLLEGNARMLCMN